MLVTIRDKVAKLKQQGRSLDETIAAKPTAAFDAKWGQFVITPAFGSQKGEGFGYHAPHHPKQRVARPVPDLCPPLGSSGKRADYGDLTGRRE
jgi:hypothetical protein